jgi:hypothetical protein
VKQESHKEAVSSSSSSSSSSVKTDDYSSSSSVKHEDVKHDDYSSNSSVKHDDYSSNTSDKVASEEVKTDLSESRSVKDSPKEDPEDFNEVDLNKFDDVSIAYEHES